jgi:putative hydrolase of the HAD superfamily
MAKRRSIFFDVGNTLLFPNRARILASLAAELHPTLAEWQAIERRTKQEFDRGLLSGRVDHGFWWMFHTYLLEQVQALDGGIRDQIIANTQNSANWDQILPGTREVLESIGRQYSIAVISNSDGGIDRVLGRCGICDCFSSITDSGVVGFEKPHPEIFAAAIRKMNADPAESLYVGDLYSVDCVGARRAGMDAVLFDVSGTYREKPFARVESLVELEEWLKQN